MTTLLEELNDTYGVPSLVEKLTAWEATFLNDVAKRQAKKSWKGFTDKQTVIVDRIKAKLAGTYVPPKKEAMSGLLPVVEMMHTALLTIKYPKVSMLCGNEPMQLTVAGSKAGKPGTVNITDGGSYGNNKWYGRISITGEWEVMASTPDAIKNMIYLLGQDPQGTVAKYGKHSGNCCFCKAELTTDESLTAGYGPVCAKNYGLKWG